MDKAEELRYVRAVYGTADELEFVPEEPPDFICRRAGRTILGVEVTELFSDESDARLKKIDDYALGLIDGEEFLHKDDRLRLKVDRAKLINKDGTVEQEVKVVAQEMPPFKNRLALLASLLKRKHRRVNDYLKSCPVVDLVISDSSNLFWFKEYKDFFSPFSHFVDRQLLTHSSFREVFLITSQEKHRVKIPLRLNLFAEHAFVLEKLVFEWAQRQSIVDPNQIVSMLLHCLCESGYGSFTAVTSEGGVGIVVGAHLYLYASGGKSIRDYVTIPKEMPRGESLSEVVLKLGHTDTEAVREITEQRADWIGCVDLFFRVESV